MINRDRAKAGLPVCKQADNSISVMVAINGHAHLLNGHVMVVYKTNPDERDYDKADIRAIYVPLTAL
jgi:hypothetical protein